MLEIVEWTLFFLLLGKQCFYKVLTFYNGSNNGPLQYREIQIYNEKLHS